MKQEWQKLLSEGIYYSYESLSFYKGFYAGLGIDDIRELPSSMNNYLHRIVNLSSLIKNRNINSACVGRYRDEHETDEVTFDFEGYSIGLFEVEINVNGDESSLDVCNASKRLSKALLIAARAHSKQIRKSDDSPYIGHLIEVINLLTNVGNVSDEDIVLGGILHDILEDTKVTRSELLNNFGSRVANIVSTLTDDKTLPLSARRQLVIKKLNSAPRSVKTIKLADLCSNSSALPKDWAKKRLTEYFLWIDQVALACRDANEALYQEYLTRRLAVS
jgi:guanosine-3',5'-bis(diphosphate) 3'-pyrophosphohydrolase